MGFIRMEGAWIPATRRALRRSLARRRRAALAFTFRTSLGFS